MLSPWRPRNQTESRGSPKEPDWTVRESLCSSAFALLFRFQLDYIEGQLTIDSDGLEIQTNRDGMTVPFDQPVR